jgi:hypothetical protein
MAETILNEIYSVYKNNEFYEDGLQYLIEFIAKKFNLSKEDARKEIMVHIGIKSGNKYFIKKIKYKNLKKNKNKNKII